MTITMELTGAQLEMVANTLVLKGGHYSDQAHSRPFGETRTRLEEKAKMYYDLADEFYKWMPNTEGGAK